MENIMYITAVKLKQVIHLKSNKQNIMEYIIKELATELAKRDYKELFSVVENMNFIDAYNKLNGYNLELSESTCKKELIGITISFDVDYKSIALTIYQTPQGGCELGESVEVWLDNVMGSIHTLDLSISEC